MQQINITPPENLTKDEKLVIKTPEGNFEVSRENKKSPKEGLTLGSILLIVALLSIFVYVLQIIKP